jgi:hypothetical protein
MAGPGSRWAFVRCAHVAIARGPRVYWDCTVSMEVGGINCLLTEGQGKAWKDLETWRHTANVSEFPIFEEQEPLPFCYLLQPFDRSL